MSNCLQGKATGNHLYSPHSLVQVSEVGRLKNTADLSSDRALSSYIYIIIISSLPFGRSLASMLSTSLYHQSSFSFRCTILLLNRQSCPSLVSLVASFPPSSVLELASANYRLELHVLSSPFSS